MEATISYTHIFFIPILDKDDNLNNIKYCQKNRQRNSNVKSSTSKSQQENTFNYSLTSQLALCLS